MNAVRSCPLHSNAVIYLLRTWTERTHGRTWLARLKEGTDPAKGQALIADALPDRIAEAAGADGLEMLRMRLLAGYGSPIRARLDLDDFKAALGTFLLVVLATFPLVIPFLLIERTALAIRISNLVALVMLFMAGWMLARHAGGTPWVGGGAMALVGTALIFAIIALGG
ncbi:hypothetical protein D9M68_462210 [compost metagenome]